MMNAGDRNKLLEQEQKPQFPEQREARVSAMAHSVTFAKDTDGRGENRASEAAKADIAGATDHNDRLAASPSKRPRLEPAPTEGQGRATSPGNKEGDSKDSDEDKDTAEQPNEGEALSPSNSARSSGSLSEADAQHMVTTDESLDRKVPAKLSATSSSQARGHKVKSRRLSFPERLMRLLDSKEEEDSMCWLPDGSAFALAPKSFTEKVLPRYFEGTKFESFTRKLNRWGFRRMPEAEAPGTFTYFHPLFRRGLPALLQNMSGGKKTDKSPLSAGQVNMLKMLQAEEAQKNAALAASLLGSRPEGMPMLGADAHLPMGQMALAEQQKAGLEGLLLRQHLLRQQQQEAARTTHPQEAELQSRLGELIQRRGQEEHLRQMMQASQAARMMSPPSNIPPQVLAEMLSRRNEAGPGALPPQSGMLGGGRFNQQAAASLSPGASMLGSMPPTASPPPNSNDPSIMEEFAQFLQLKSQQRQQQQERDLDRVVTEEVARQLRGPPSHGPRFS